MGKKRGEKGGKNEKKEKKGEKRWEKEETRVTADSACREPVRAASV